LGVNLSRRNELLMWSALGSALFAAVGNLVLVPRLGAEGAAMATFSGYAVSAVITYVIAQRVHPVPYRGARLAALFAAGVTLGALASRLATAGGAAGVGLAARAGAIAVFALLAWKMDVWKDRGAIRHRPVTPG
jgi:O-antigen/teichoic acid export membrane protein